MYFNLVDGTVDNDLLNGTSQTDLIMALEGNDTVNGAEGNDIINGDTGDDVIAGGAGDDTINGGDGNDLIFGDNYISQDILDDNFLAEELGTSPTVGNDVIYGGNGNDTVFGNQGHDTIEGGEGDDIVRANGGDDLVSGGDGNDFITGQAGNDILRGDAGDDMLKGEIGNDFIDGGGGNDGIWGGAGNDSLLGGAGNDLIDDTEGGNDCILGGDGNDTLYAGDDQDIISGGDGNDNLFGDAGNDTLGGGAGDDQINGGQGDDVIYGDNYIAPTNLGQNLVVNGSFETNSVCYGYSKVFSSIQGWTTTFGSGIEVKEQVRTFGAAADGHAWVELDSYGNSGMVQNIDTTAGEKYQVSFDYKARQGVSASSNGIEVYWNGELIDTITEDGKSYSSCGGCCYSYDTQALSWNTYTYTLEAGSGDLTGLEFRAVGSSDCYGGFIDDVKVQQVYQDTLRDKLGTQTVTGNDHINGGDGNDLIFGGAGFDTIFGGAGNDTINGTDGVNAGYNQEDRLNGGLGADTFILGNSDRTFYNSQGWTDCVIIEDFNPNEDKIQLNDDSSYWLGSSGNGNSYLWEYTSHGWDGVAMLENVQVNNCDLNSSAFQYV